MEQYNLDICKINRKKKWLFDVLGALGLAKVAVLGDSMLAIKFDVR